MNDVYGTVVTLIFITTILVITFIMGLYTGRGIGRTEERERIYDKCLVENDRMIYNELTLKCKEIIK